MVSAGIASAFHSGRKEGSKRAKGYDLGHNFYQERSSSQKSLLAEVLISRTRCMLNREVFLPGYIANPSPQITATLRIKEKGRMDTK